MRAGKGSSDAYLADWAAQRAAPLRRRSDRPRPRRKPRGSKRSYTDEDLERLIRAKGVDANRDASDAGSRTGLPSPPDVRSQALVGAPCARPERLLSRASRPCWCACTACFAPWATSGSSGPSAGIERAVKGLLFDCRMCGQCVLSSTGMSCPMNCPKTLRNGPVRRGSRQRQLRGQARHAMRLGRGLPGQRAHPGRRRGDAQRCSLRWTSAVRAAPRGCGSRAREEPDRAPDARGAP